MVNVLLAASGGGGDGAVDVVEVSGTATADAVTLGADGAGVRVTGLRARVVVRDSELANDRLDVLGFNGADDLDGSLLPVLKLVLRLFGGGGPDVLTGSSGNDYFDGGTGIDTIIGGAGTDTAVNGEDVTGVP